MSISQTAARAQVEQYFDSFNRGQFEQTASLFSPAGQLIPPFEGSIVGSENILHYLNKQANSMAATPQDWTVAPKDGGQWQVDVLGKVKALVFQVNVSWQFLVTATGEIERADIKLMASPKELLSLRSVAAT